MDIRDSFKKYGKQFLKSASTYSKHTPVRKTVSAIPKAETIKRDILQPSPEPLETESLKQKPRKTERIDYEKEFIKHFKQLTYKHRSLDVWRDFVTMFSCSISNSLDKQNFDKREKMYLQIINKYDKDEQDIFPKLAADTVMALEENSEQDFLGHIYMNLGLGSKNTSQFFTPYHICRIMAEATVNDVITEVKEKGYISINDPCCGAGATLIAGVHAAKKHLEKENINYQNHILVVAQDIDFAVAAMCYIQLSLLGVAGYVKVGNSLTDPISERDDLDNYWFTPMYFSDVWTTRQLFRKIDNILKGGTDID